MNLQRRTFLGLGAAAATVAATADTAAASEGATSDAALARTLRGGFRDGYAEVNGTRLHYVAGGRGEPLVLLPGWPQTWWEYRKVMPALAERYRVIVVELRGMGGSAKPPAGYDKKTMAADIHELVRRLGYDQVNIAGHDIGSMVAFSFAANHPAATRKVALLDVPHPDPSLFELPMLPVPGVPFHLWWFAFNQVHGLPEQLLTGRARFLIDYLFGIGLHDQTSIGDRDRAIYARAYNFPDAIRAGNGWYQTFGQDIADMGTYSTLTMPVLGVASSDNPTLAAVLPDQAVDARVVTLDSGHYLVEERPAGLIDALTGFFG